MRRRSSLLSSLVLVAAISAPSLAKAQTPPPVVPGAKQTPKNANPCRDEVAAALTKLRKSSWFRMETNMLTEKGPTSMRIDYVLPDRMHQIVKVQLTNTVTEVIMVGDKAWSKDATGAWQPVDNSITQQLRAQMQETVVEQQQDVGNYSCKGRTTIDGRDVMSYKLEDEGPKEGVSDAPKNEAFRLFYVDVLTGLPVSNALVVAGREDKPLFKANYSFPLDIKIEAPTAPAPAAAP